MKQTVNRTEKRPQPSIQPRRQIVLMVWMPTLLALLAASCGDSSALYDAALPIIPVGGSNSLGDAALPTSNEEGSEAPMANDSAQNAVKNDASRTDSGIADAARDTNSYVPNDAGPLLDAASPDATSPLEDATGPNADSATPPTDTSVEVDECPDDPSKTEPGLCGCGNEDPLYLDATAIDCVQSHLVHRYRFDGTGTTATDDVGSANGTIHGDGNQASGKLTLGGDQGTGYSNEGYVELPASILAGLTNATFEVWVTWDGEGATGSPQWQRIFDFGDQNGSEGNSYLFLTPQGASGTLIGFTTDRDRVEGDDNVETTTALPQGVQKHLAVVVDAASSMLCLYIDGVFERSAPMRGALAQVNTVNRWLGRSNYTVDSEFNGEYHEFRVWDIALNDQQMSASFSSGPDYEF